MAEAVGAENRVERPSTRRTAALIVAGIVAGLAVVALLVVTVAFDRYTIPSQSMVPTVGPGGSVLTRPSSGRGLHRGDIIVLRPPLSLGRSLGVDQVIGRVVAIEGDTVSATGGHLQINGADANEAYLPSGITTPDIPQTPVPAAHVYVLGDNRTNSQGSRIFGPVPFASVNARVVRIGAPSSMAMLGGTLVLCLPLIFLLAARRRSRRQGREPRRGRERRERSEYADWAEARRSERRRS
ncbi:MAG: signal peptidase [Acidimicrobiales bacterium]|nr:signal peptidase [Acidimicrobiales bacterium]